MKKGRTFEVAIRLTLLIQPFCTLRWAPFLLPIFRGKRGQ